MTGNLETPYSRQSALLSFVHDFCLAAKIFTALSKPNSFQSSLSIDRTKYDFNCVQWPGSICPAGPRPQIQRITIELDGGCT